MSNSSSVSDIRLNSNKVDLTLSLLEKGITSSNFDFSVEYIQSKLAEFSNFFNSICRISLLNCTTSENEELIYLLLALKKSIKSSVFELNKSLTRREYLFNCGLCNDLITVEAGQNMWDTLQDHEHFEQLYYDFLTHRLPLPTYETNSTYSGQDCEYNKNNVQKEINEVLVNGTAESEDIVTNGVETEEDVNSFRFNFVIKYDEVIENKIYPKSLMDGVRKIDKIRDYTMQRSGNTRAQCLICPCELNRARVTKYVLVSHAMGQRHLRFAANPVTINALQTYHETWLKHELPIQAHQVYFRPDVTPNIKCLLCNTLVKSKNVESHILADAHKKTVLIQFEKKSNLYFLMNLQVQVYGIAQEQIEANKNEMKVTKEDNKKKENSDSDTGEESKKSKEHNIIKSIDIQDSTDVLELLPNRFKEHLQFIKRVTKNKKTVLICEVCKCNLPEEVEIIKSHIRQSVHSRLAVGLKKYNYYCEICNIRVADENLWTKHFVQGPNRHQTMAESRKSKVTEYECTNCCTVIYGDDLSLNRHLSIGSKRGKTSKAITLPAPIKQLFRSVEAIQLEGKRLADEAEDVLNNQLTNECCRRLEHSLTELFEGCKVYPFGSRVSGLGNKDSDLDVFVDTGDMYLGYQNQDAMAQIQLIRKASRAFHKYKDEFQNIVQIPTARTPIVKVHHIPTELDCDLSFRHGLSVENTKFIRFCLDLQPISQPFILMLKKWSEHNNLEQITTYALAIMAIFYLQTKGYLLSVQRLRELNNTKAVIINGWNTINYTVPLEEIKSHVLTYPSTVDHLLQEFFDYYSKFQYGTNVICPLLGYTISKNTLTENNLIPKEMVSYVEQLQSDEAEIFRVTSALCIQDPFDLSHNLTKACQQGTVLKLKALCNLMEEHLNSIE